MKPIIKWAGGKRWLLPILEKIFEPHQGIKLVEPFIGGMAVALGLNPESALLNDVNVHLINFYKQVKKGLKIPYQFKNNADFYYEMRDKFNTLISNNKYRNAEAASIFYFLIRTGYNGLCRFNSQGEFNVPFGQHRSIKYKTDFFEYKEILKNWNLMQGDFQNLELQGNEFLYADPPYDVEFTEYYAKGFTWDDQLRLAKWLSEHKGPVVASNQATKRILELYQDLKFKIFIVSAPRKIACNGDRQPALEMLALKGFKTNFMKDIRDKIKL